MTIRTCCYERIVVGLEKPKTRVRFQVSVWGDDDRFMFGLNGWTMDEHGTIRMPGTRASFSHKVQTFGYMSQEFQDALRAYLYEVPDVRRHLGERKLTRAEQQRIKRQERALEGPEMIIKSGVEGK